MENRATLCREGVRAKYSYNVSRSVAHPFHSALASIIAAGGIPQLFQQLRQPAWVASMLLHQLPLYENRVGTRLPRLARVFNAAAGA